MMGSSLHAMMLALYVGPDQLMPLASVLAAVSGAVMIFWRRIVGVARRVQSFLTKQ